MKGQSIHAHWPAILADYYRQMGWDLDTGKPMPETLDALGLEDVRADLWAS